MSNFAIKVLSCRHGRISYLSAETLQTLIENLDKENLNPNRRAARLVELGFMALANDYHATALELFRRMLNNAIPADADMSRTRITPYQRRLILRAAAGIDIIWRKKGISDSNVRRNIVELLSEIHYLRLGIDYDEVLSEMKDFYKS